MIKSAEGLVAVHTHTHTDVFANEKALVAFLRPEIKS